MTICQRNVNEASWRNGLELIRMLKLYARHLRDNKSLIGKAIVAIITRATDRSIIPARFSTSVVNWSSDPDIVKYLEFIKKVTLQAGEVSRGRCMKQLRECRSVRLHGFADKIIGSNRQIFTQTRNLHQSLF